ncbi:transcription factor MYBS3-like [Bidens hawaiensis]|uniref:transcription factor MYBS3-like n=1 Tax=Bidens hawaiensis TaxID=980011 RepID=UPI00404A9CD9
MTRRCSHCSHNGHNSRTCPTRGVKLFGVRLTDGGSIMKKSASMGNLSAQAAVSPVTFDHIDDGYMSDDPAQAKRRADRKKGTPWTEDEHRLFLLGLQKLGKGDWRGIARNYVLSRTPTQVASHAQKYFIRQCSSTRRKRCYSLFDMAAEPPEDHFLLPPAARADHTDNSNEPNQQTEASTSEILNENIKEEALIPPANELPPIIPAFYPAYIPIPFPVWPSMMSWLDESTNYNITGPDASHHRVVKPIPSLLKEPMCLDELVGMSKQLSLKDSDHHHNIEPSPLSLKLLTERSRQSAFHVNKSVGGGNGDGFGAV